MQLYNIIQDANNKKIYKLPIKHQEMYAYIQNGNVCIYSEDTLVTIISEDDS